MLSLVDNFSTFSLFLGASCYDYNLHCLLVICISHTITGHLGVFSVKDLFCPEFPVRVLYILWIQIFCHLYLTSISEGFAFLKINATFINISS